MGAMTGLLALRQNRYGFVLVTECLLPALLEHLKRYMSVSDIVHDERAWYAVCSGYSAEFEVREVGQRPLQYSATVHTVEGKIVKLSFATVT
jgi:hypothetical protein